MQRKTMTGRRWILLAGLVLAGAVLACGPISTGNVEQMATAVLEAAESSGSGGQGSASDATEEPANQPPEATEPPAPSGDEPVETAEPSGDPGCLVGTWQTVPGTVEAYLSNTFNAYATDAPVTFGVEEVGGHLTMSFDESGMMTGAADEYRVTVTIEELGAAIDVVVVLSGSAQYSADGSTLTVTDPDYQGTSVGDGIVQGIQTGEQEVVVNITPGAMSVEGGPFSVQESGDTGGAGQYECSGDTLRTSFSEYGNIEWMRVN